MHAQVEHVPLVTGIEDTGMPASSNVHWLSQASVDDFAIGSSPQNATASPSVHENAIGLGARRRPGLGTETRECHIARSRPAQ